MKRTRIGARWADLLLLFVLLMVTTMHTSVVEAASSSSGATANKRSRSAAAASISRREEKEESNGDDTLEEGGDPDRNGKNATFYEECSMSDVEGICANSVKMITDDGMETPAPGVMVWMQAHCGDIMDEQRRALCVLSFIGDDFGEDQAANFFACVCDECPRSCNKKGNLRNRQNQIHMEKQ